MGRMCRVYLPHEHTTKQSSPIWRDRETDENEFSVVFAFSDPPGRIHPIMRIRNAVFGAWLFLLVAVVILRQVQTVYTHTLGTTNEKL